MPEETQTTDLQEQVDALASDNEKLILTEHAYKQVLTKLGIDLDTVFTEDAMKSVGFNTEGKVIGEFDFTPPETTKPRLQPRRNAHVPTPEADTVLTLDRIKKMTVAEVKENWDAVQKVLQQK